MKFKFLILIRENLIVYLVGGAMPTQFPPGPRLNQKTKQIVYLVNID